MLLNFDITARPAAVTLILTKLVFTRSLNFSWNYYNWETATGWKFMSSSALERTNNKPSRTITGQLGPWALHFARLPISDSSQLASTRRYHYISKYNIKNAYNVKWWSARSSSWSKETRVLPKSSQQWRKYCKFRVIKLNYYCHYITFNIIHFCKNL